MAFVLSLGGDLASRFAPPRGSLFRARPASSCTRCQTCLGLGPLKRAVGCSFLRVAAMPVSSRGPRRRRSWWCHTPLIDSGYPHACEAGGVQMRPCRHGLIWDHTVFHVVPHWRARPEIVAPLRSVTVGLPSGSPAHPDAPGVRTPSRCAPGMSPSGRWFRGISSVVLCHRIHTGTPAQGRVDHLHHHTPVTLCDHPTTWAASTAVTGLYVEHQTTLTPSGSNQMEALQVDEQITPITTTRRHRVVAGRVRHRPRSLTIAGVEVRSSSRTSTSTRNPRPTPGHPHSTLKSPITVPSPEQARMMPVWVPERFQGLVSKETTKPMRNMSKNLEMFKTMTRPMRLLWCRLSGRESICSRALGLCS